MSSPHTAFYFICTQTGFNKLNKKDCLIYKRKTLKYKMIVIFLVMMLSQLIKKLHEKVIDREVIKSK